MYEDLAEAVEADFARARKELEQLVSIPSVSHPDFDPEPVRRSAAAVAQILSDAGVDDVRFLEIDGAHPAVYGTVTGPAGAPTVLLYAHHDVQPPGPAEEWASDPFAPVERDGRLYGRGAADDKAGVVLHAAVLRAFGASPPVNLKVFIEGEEEVGSSHLDEFIAAYADLLAADVVVIADSGNLAPGVPSLTSSLRGLVDCTVEVTTIGTAVHSGEFGGPFPDAITVLGRIIAALHDDAGNVAVTGLVEGEAGDVDLTEEELRRQTGAVEGLELIGTGSLTTRMWRKPAISVLAVDAPPINQAINQIVPRARAKVSMRIPPGQDPDAAMAALTAHIEAAAPWGARVTVTPGARAEAIEIDTTGPAPRLFAEALAIGYDAPVVEVGVGGTIPLVAALLGAHPEAAMILKGVADRTSNAHGPDESVSLADLRSGILSEAIALRLLGSA
jgi:acetylornithine deacetylase/succinyl-diaminopimelate desuccinylase-like protein